MTLSKLQDQIMDRVPDWEVMILTMVLASVFVQMLLVALDSVAKVVKVNLYVKIIIANQCITNFDVMY